MHLHNYSECEAKPGAVVTYDPNYNYESDDEDEGMDTDELEQDELYGFGVAV